MDRATPSGVDHLRTTHRYLHAQLLRPREAGGFGLDAIWSDDFHHVVRVMLTGSREGYYAAYLGTATSLAATLEHGWFLAGEAREPQSLGTAGAADEFAPYQFILCVSNHDQIGNHAFGSRLNQLISPVATRVPDPARSVAR